MELNISIYELLALILSSIAILMPLFKWLINKYAIKPVLKHIPTGQIGLLFNTSGPYVRLDGVYKAENKPISVEKIRVSIKRRKDDKKLNLDWATLISPMYQSMGVNYLHTNEAAHPFQIEKDSIVCAFTEFVDAYDSFTSKFNDSIKPLVDKINEVISCATSDEDSFRMYCDYPEYNSAKNQLIQDLFWEVGNYDIDLIVSYGDNEEHFEYSFYVGDDNYKKLKRNIDEVLLLPLKKEYNKKLDFQFCKVELRKE